MASHHFWLWSYRGLENCEPNPWVVSTLKIGLFLCTQFFFLDCNTRWLLLLHLYCNKIYSLERSNEMMDVLMRAPLILFPYPHSPPTFQSFQQESLRAQSLVLLVKIVKSINRSLEVKALWNWTESSLKQNRLVHTQTGSILFSLLQQKEQNAWEHYTSISQQQQHMWETEHHHQVDQRYCKQMTI